MLDCPDSGPVGPHDRMLDTIILAPQSPRQGPDVRAFQSHERRCERLSPSRCLETPVAFQEIAQHVHSNHFAVEAFAIPESFMDVRHARDFGVGCLGFYRGPTASAKGGMQALRCSCLWLSYVPCRCLLQTLQRQGCQHQGRPFKEMRQSRGST